MIPPKFIEFETSTYCNRMCPWCPNSTNNRSKQKKYADMGMWIDFLKDIDNNGYTGWLSFHNYNEPLANPRLFEYIRTASQISPNTKLALYTNGDYLSDVYLKKILHHKIDEVRITLYPSCTKNNHHLISILNQFIGSNIFNIKPQITYRGDEYYYQIDETYFVIILARIQGYSNRAGDTTIFNNNFIRKTPCYIPSNSASIDYEGNLKMCCQIQDVINKENGKYLIGNIKQYSFFNLWNSAKMNMIRQKLLVSNFDGFDMCKSCNFHI